MADHVPLPLTPQDEGLDAPAPGPYRHFKGNRYEVTGVARHSETLDWVVLYRRADEPGPLWVRPLAMWSEPVERPDGTSGPRFAPNA